MSSEDLAPQEYIGATHPTRSALISLAATWTALQLVKAQITCHGQRRVSFTLSWGAVGSTDGDFGIEVSDDPRAELDLLRVDSSPAYTPVAVWNAASFPAGSVDGTQITHTAGTKIITINANAGKCRINLADPHPFIRLTWVRRTGGGATQLAGWASGTGK